MVRRPRPPSSTACSAPWRTRGSLDVLRHGFKCYGKQLDLAYFAPAHGMNPATQALYESNRLTVTRQLKYSLDKRELASTWSSASTACPSSPPS